MAMKKQTMFLTTTGALMGAVTGLILGPKKLGLVGQVLGGAVVGALAHNGVAYLADGKGSDSASGVEDDE